MGSNHLKNYLKYALIFVVCAVCIFLILHDENTLNAEDSNKIRETYAGYAMTFPADAPYQSFDALLAATPYTDIDLDQYVIKNYDTEAFVPYLPLAEHISAVQTSPLDSKGETIYIIFTDAEGAEFLQCYEKGVLTNQTVYLPGDDIAYEITDRKVKLHENFREKNQPNA